MGFWGNTRDKTETPRDIHMRRRGAPKSSPLNLPSVLNAQRDRQEVLALSGIGDGEHRRIDA